MSMSLLAGIPTQKNNYERIIAHFSDSALITYSQGETVINGLDEPQGVYLINEGFVKSYSVTENGHANLLLIHQAGEFIPLPWALDGDYTTGLFYQAMNKVTVLRTSKNKLRSAMTHNSWFSQEVLKQSVDASINYTKRIQALEIRSARGRIISEILNLFERFGEENGKELFINAHLTHQDIADSVNISRETASRILEQLFKEGLMRQRNHLFTVTDLSRLQNAL